MQKDYTLRSGNLKRWNHWSGWVLYSCMGRTKERA